MDIFDKNKRSEIMSNVKNKDTKPEMVVRKTLHHNGFRYGLYNKDLPGKPDLVLRKYKIAVFINGCFWHGHDCKKGKRPTTNKKFWNEKLDKNLLRDRNNYVLLQQKGWDVTIIWECEMAQAIDILLSRLNELRANNS